MALTAHLYNTSIKIYHLLMRGISLFHPKAKLWIEGRRHLIKKIKESNIGDQPSILIHCSSLGEFEQGRPLLEQIKAQYPKYKIILSFFSPSGFEIEKTNNLADLVIYLPVDTKNNVLSFVKLLNLKKAFFIKYEYWPNLFSALQKIDCPIYMVSAIFREDQFFFKPNAKWYRKNTLAIVNHFFIQNEASASILKKHKFKNFSITGDTRFDRVIELSESNFSDQKIEDFIQSSYHTLVAGSSWFEDEKIISTFLQQEEGKNWKTILAPHEIHESHLVQIEKLCQGIKYVRYSKATNEELKEAQILIIDNIGKLKFLYRYADICYIGGGFGAGIHNTLEPASYGKPVIFGPKYQKFDEAKQLLEINAAKTINNQDEFKSALLSFINSRNYEMASQKASHFVRQYKGATQKIIDKTF